MNQKFKNVAFFFFLGFGAFYLSSDFLINQGNSESETLKLIYDTFDMPFFFSAGMYALASLHLYSKKKYDISGVSLLFWILAVLWTVLLVYLNLGYESFL